MASSVQKLCNGSSRAFPLPAVCFDNGAKGFDRVIGVSDTKTHLAFVGPTLLTEIPFAIG